MTLEGIFDEGVLNKIVSVAIRDSIKAHGPITPNTVGSAAKRIAGSLQGELRKRSLVDLTDETLKSVLSIKDDLIRRQAEKIVTLAKSNSDLLQMLVDAGVTLPGSKFQTKTLQPESPVVELDS